MKRSKLYKQKRTTPRGLLLRALAAALVLTALFAVYFQISLTRDVFSKALEAVGETAGSVRHLVESSRLQDDGQPEGDTLRMDLYNFAKQSDYFFVKPGPEIGIFDEPEICPRTSLNCHSCIVLVNDDGSVAASNRLILGAYLLFPENDPVILRDDDSDDYYWDRRYICDPEALQIPELDQLFELYLKLKQDPEADAIYISSTFTSIYINRETHSFIPHKGVLKKETASLSVFFHTAQEYEDTWETAGEYPVEINVELPGYELVELHRPVSANEVWNDEVGAYRTDFERNQKEQEYPYTSNKDMLFFGETSEVLREFEQLEAFLPERGTGSTYTGDDIPGDSRVVARMTDCFDVGKEHYTLHVRMMLDYKDPILMNYYWKCVGLFAGIVTLLALLRCWRKNVLNQARYAMEDYQRGLTDCLAHDIKTPLMAISGYAENIRDGKLPEEKQTKYVTGILNNVAYTDSLISRTLYLNHMEPGKKSKPEAVQLAVLAEKLLAKYDLMLREKHIQTEVSGSAEPRTDPAAMETVLENLLSNAVKYTPEGGNIQIEMDKKRLRVTNTVGQKIDVKKLKEPFFRGDAARSNTKGNGLGLAIADRAANANGCKLKLSCTDTEFHAELKF